MNSRNNRILRILLIIALFFVVSFLLLENFGHLIGNNDTEKMIKSKYSSNYYREYEVVVETVVKDLKYNGFKNIRLEPIYDLTFGIVKKEKEVEKVVIDGQDIYNQGDEFLNTSLVQIFYHDFARNKPAETQTEKQTKKETTRETANETLEETIKESIPGYCGTFIGADRSLLMISKNSALFYSYALNENVIYEEVEYYIEDNNVVLNTNKLFGFKIYFEKKDTYFDDISYDLKSTNEKWSTEKLYKWSDRFDYSRKDLKNISRSSKSIKRMNINSLIKMFKNDGYTDIVLSPIYDIVLGIINYAGEIDRVAVDGETKFDSYLEFPSNSEIKIYYHEDISKKTDSDDKNKIETKEKTIKATDEIKTGWVKENNDWHYYDSDGSIVKSKWIDKKYYVDENGIMLSSCEKEIDGQKYVFEENGEAKKVQSNDENGYAETSKIIEETNVSESENNLSSETKRTKKKRSVFDDPDVKMTRFIESMCEQQYKYGYKIRGLYVTEISDGVLDGSCSLQIKNSSGVWGSYTLHCVADFNREKLITWDVD